MPRDPKRIEKVLNVIRGVWHQYPDLRLGQLLLNSIEVDEHLYYMEDDELVELVKRYAIYQTTTCKENIDD